MGKALERVAKMDLTSVRDFDLIRERSDVIVLELLGNQDIGSKKELAEQLEIDPSMITRIILGERFLPRRSIIKISEMLKESE